MLFAPRTYHVAPAGSDANSGLSAGEAFATLQKAVDSARHRRRRQPGDDPTRRRNAGAALKAGAEAQIQGLKLAGQIGIWMRYGAIVFVRGKMGLRHGGGVPYRRRQRRLCGDHRHDRDRRRRAAHLFANQNGHILMTKSKVTLTGTPAFSNAFAVAQYTGLVSAYSNRYSDAATGVRYRASGNSVIFVSGGANTVFPGDAAGVVTGRGQYL